MPDIFCKSIAQKGVFYFPHLSFSSPLLLNCSAAWRDLSEISLILQYLHVEVIDVRRIIRKMFFPFVLPYVDIGINSSWLWSVPRWHWKILTLIMHLTQALKEHAKDKGSLVLLWEIRNQKNTPVPYVFLCICKHKINRGQDQLLWMWKLHWKEENKVRFSCLTSGIPQWSGTSFSRKHLTFWKKKINGVKELGWFCSSFCYTTVLTRGSTPGKWNTWPDLNLNSAHFQV